MRGTGRQMEVLILLPARLLAVPDTLALALDTEHVPLVAELTLPDLHTTLVLIFESKLGRTNLDNDYLIVKIVVFHRERRSHIWLQGRTREFHTRVLFRFTLFYTKTHNIRRLII